MNYLIVAVIISFCVHGNPVNSQNIFEIKCNEYVKYGVHSRIENGKHLGRLFIHKGNQKWTYAYATLISDRFAITKAKNIVDIPLTDLYFKQGNTRFDISEVKVNPLFTGNFRQNDLALIKLSRTDSNFRYACIWKESARRPIKTKSTFIANQVMLKNITEHPPTTCARSDSTITSSHSCINFVEIISGSPLYYNANDIIYIKSVFGYHTPNKLYDVGNNIIQHIDWIEKIVWPDLHNLKTQCEKQC